VSEDGRPLPVDVDKPIVRVDALGLDQPTTLDERREELRG
jgi:hypothetical protein